ncbi:class I SAM-dependent methyltransferase [Halomicrococcus sp. NG-SE-24]|uniref:class I SAM-dependent methyltransferase n=1 Tax=Halomicrococcus sp. NG-SE-24 TaxID=3436928 RepID=UPI003D961719
MAEFRNTGQPDWDWWETLWPDPEGVLRNLGLEPDDRVAEVGCGDGYFALPAAETAEEVYAVDLNEELLADLRSAAERRGVAVDVATIPGDADDLPDLLPRPATFALLANVLHGVPEPASFLDTVAESLTDRGRVGVVNWRDRPREETTVDGEPRGPPADLRMPPTATERALADAGYEVATVVDLPPYHYGVVAER